LSERDGAEFGDKRAGMTLVGLERKCAGQKTPAEKRTSMYATAAVTM
jgi:hypothetical protein